MRASRWWSWAGIAFLVGLVAVAGSIVVRPSAESSPLGSVRDVDVIGYAYGTPTPCSGAGAASPQ